MVLELLMFKDEQIYKLNFKHYSPNSPYPALKLSGKKQNHSVVGFYSPFPFLASALASSWLLIPNENSGSFLFSLFFIMSALTSSGLRQSMLLLLSLRLISSCDRLFPARSH
jgi:hypothetical protein